MKKMAASEFKARCLALMDDVCATGESVVITKHGKPVAKLVPMKRDPEKLFNSMKGMIDVRGDIVAPAVDAKDWKLLR